MICSGIKNGCECYDAEGDDLILVGMGRYVVVNKENRILGAEPVRRSHANEEEHTAEKRVLEETAARHGANWNWDEMKRGSKRVRGRRAVAAPTGYQSRFQSSNSSRGETHLREAYVARRVMASTQSDEQRQHASEEKDNKDSPKKGAGESILSP